MLKKYILLNLIFINNVIFCKSEKNITLKLNDINNINKLYFKSDITNSNNKLGDIKFNKSKKACDGYDVVDLSMDFKKNYNENEYKINSFLILPVSNKEKQYWNNLLIFKKNSSLGFDISSILNLNQNPIDKFLWKNIFSCKYEIKKNELREITIKNKEKIAQHLNEATSEQINEIYSLINSFKRNLEISPGQTINFTTALLFKKNLNWDLEIGYNLSFKNKGFAQFNNIDREKFQFFDINNLLIAIDLKEYEQSIKSNNINLKLEDLELGSSKNNTANKFYLLFNKNIKINNKIITLGLNISYTFEDNKKNENINISTNIFYNF